MHPGSPTEPRNDTYHVITVCLGNICRSPMAESVLRAEIDRAGLAELVDVDSAGTGDWHVGGDADHRAQATLRDNGYSLDHQAKQFNPAWFEERDLILVMDANNLSTLRGWAKRVGVDDAHVRLLRSFDPAADHHEVPDPYYGGMRGFQDTLEMIEAAARGVVAHIELELQARRTSQPPN